MNKSNSKPEITEEESPFLACPCCGYQTIRKRDHFEICTVCWWEDDGQDNENADIIYGGPNERISLTQGRFNFIRVGIYNPDRLDLLKKSVPSNKYGRGRFFEIEGEFVFERGTNWKGKII
jgi:hypothetical protein